MKWRSHLAVLAALVSTVMATGVALVIAGTGASAATPYCGITWGSLPKSASVTARFPNELTGVRSGRHTCYDRLVLDIDGRTAGYSVRYVTTFYDQGRGEPIPLAGGAKLEVIIHTPAYDMDGNTTYAPANPARVVNVTGYATFRQVAWGGSFEAVTGLGVGVRARLPFRVFVLEGPGTGSRLVIDVAHRW